MMFIYTQAQLQAALVDIANWREVFYDIETSALKSWQGHIIGIGVSSFVRGYYVPTRRYMPETGVLEELPGAESLARQLLAAIVGKRICAFNGAFDLPFTKHDFDVDLLPSYYCDVLLLKHTVDEEFPFKLKEIAVQVFGYGAASEQRDLQAQLKARGASKHEIYKADIETIGKYCIQDCLLTARLYRHYSAKLEEQGLTKFFYEDEVMPLYKHVTIPMEQYGLRLDLPLMQSTLTDIKQDIARLEASIQLQIKPLLEVKFNAWFLGKDYEPSIKGNFGQAIAKFYGMDALLPLTKAGKLSITKSTLAKLPEGRCKSILSGQAEMTREEIQAVQKFMADVEHGVGASLFNLQSKHHLKKLFFDTLGLEPLSRTDLGNPQVDDDFIESIKSQYTWAADLSTYNRLQKIRATYIERFLDGQHEGIFYPSFFQHRTVSGRYGSDLQQMPKRLAPKDEPLELVRRYVNVVRDFFIARPGCKLIGSDYESLEPKIFSHVSTDPKLHAIFHRGDDFYSTIAIDTEGLAEYSPNKSAPNYLGELDKSKRQRAKAYALGIAYGMSGYKLAFELNIPQEDAEKLVEKYLQAYPQLAQWMTASKEYAIAHGFIASQAGRIRHLPRVKEFAEKYGTNILDSLWLYKEYSNEPHLYEQMKKVRKEFQNGLNNAMNFQIQSMAASIVNQAAIAIMREFRAKDMSATICMNVHDELVVEAPDSEVEQACTIMQRVMETNRKLDVPLLAEPQVAIKYGDTK